MIGRTLGHFRILEKLGAGGMGEVYRARDERLERDVAIKVLPAGTLADEAARKRFRQEALALSKLNHPNIATVHEFATDSQVDFLVMEYVGGNTLNEKLAAGPLAEKEILLLGEELAEGLAAAHEQGVIHCDLKPGNLHVTPDGRLKVLDFGLARFLSPAGDAAPTQSESQVRDAAGTLPYMSPEQINGSPPDPRSDIYAAGAVLYEMATGQRLFPSEREPQLQLAAILHRAPRPPRTLNPHISDGLESVILKCLEKDPEHRYQSAREIVADLRRLGATTSMINVSGDGARHRFRKTLMAGICVATVAALALAGGWWRLRSRARAAAAIHSLAVLPMTNLSGDPEQEYFADGMTEELMTDLSQVSALKVISRTSAMRYKGTKLPLSQIASELNVAAIVEGSVLKADGRVRITAQLIEAATDRQIWARSYERDLKDVLALQDDVARAITQEIQIRLSPREVTHLAAARPVNPAAHEAYLKGRYFWNQRNREAVMKGLEYFQEAVKLEPGYPLPYVGVADSYIVLAADQWLSPAQALPRAKAAALTAQQLDDSVAEAHVALANIAEEEWNWREAEIEFKRALELNPSYAVARQWYSIFLMKLGRHDEAVAEAKRAEELDPLSAIVNINEAQILYMARRYEEAKQVALKTLELAPDFYAAHCYLGIIDLHMGKPEDGIAELEKAATLSADNDLVVGFLGYAYGRSGRKAEAHKALQNLLERSKQRYVSPYCLALVSVGLGERDEAILWLERAYKERESMVPEIGQDPAFDPLRSELRFLEILRRMNLPAANSSP